MGTMIFWTVVDATRKVCSDRLLFGFGRTGTSDSTDWVGSVFVKADGPEEAEEKFHGFFREHATEWNLDEAPEVVEMENIGELDLEVIELRRMLPFVVVNSSLLIIMGVLGIHG